MIYDNNLNISLVVLLPRLQNLPLVSIWSYPFRTYMYGDQAKIKACAEYKQQYKLSLSWSSRTTGDPL